jgi:type I pantothenate kinase
VPPGYDAFSRARWAALARRHSTGLSDTDAQGLAATGEPMSPDEVTDIYLPLAELITLRAATKREADGRIAAFLVGEADRQEDAGAPAATAPVPFIVGIAGGVAVGKSTTARVLQALLRHNGQGRRVDLLTTDGFLFDNTTLEARGLMTRKGFPESYDQRRLVHALRDLRAGVAEVSTPVYSHVAYDIVPDQVQVLRRPDIVLVEGLNVLQVNTRGAPPDQAVVSDFFDFSIYVDGPEEEVARWYTERLLALRATVLQEPGSFFHRFADLSDDEVIAIARQVWADINLVNLRENILPTRGRADLVLEKGPDHRVSRLLLKRT